MCLAGLRAPFLAAANLLIIFSVNLVAQSTPVARSQGADLSTDRESAHRSPEWPSIAKHLPNPATASASDLEAEGDILRARRFPEDAIDFYGYALSRGANVEEIDMKIGMTHLEMRHVALARVYFQRVVKVNRKDATGWNNLGAVEYLNHDYKASINAYKRAVKLNDRSATYHSNLGMAYFDSKDYKRSRQELTIALDLDPSVFSKGSSSGVSAQVLSPQDRARFCLEMAKTYVLLGDRSEMMHSLAMASEAGMDLMAEMSKDKVLARYLTDPEIPILIQNAKALRSGGTGVAEGETGSAAKPTAE